MAKRGRKRKWRDSFVERAYEYARENYGTDDEIAAELGVGRTLYYEWKASNSDFADAIRRGREEWRRNGCGSVVRSLYKSCDVLIVEVPTISRKKRLINGVLTVVEQTEKIEKHVFPPSQRAREFVLLNQDPANWKVRPGEDQLDGPTAAELVRQSLSELDAMHQEVQNE